MFLSPALLLLLLTRVVPLFEALGTSIGSFGDGTFLDTYRVLFSSESFWNSVRVTLWFSLIINPVQIAAALLLALLLTQRLPGSGLWRLVIFLPVAVPQAVSVIIWSIAFRPTDGLLNSVLQVLGIGPQPFLTSPDQALYAIILLLSWVGVGFWMLFLIAGLQEIPKSTLDAAAVDGAGWWRTFFSVKLPLLARPLAFVLVADTAANFLVFVPFQATRGGPAGSTNVIIHEIYRQAYTFFDLPLAFAHVVILTAIMLTIVSIQFVLLQRLAG